MGCSPQSPPVSLSKSARVSSVSIMLRPCLFVSALLAWGLPSTQADTIQLKDKAAITGKVLAEKSDHIAVDVGYTVLVIPRSQVVKILEDDDQPAPASKSTARVKARPASPRCRPTPKPGFYSAPGKLRRPSAPCASW